MALTAYLNWQAPDATESFNRKFRELVHKGVFPTTDPLTTNSWDGKLVPGVGLTIQVNPFAAASGDGMIVVSNAITTIAIPPPIVDTVYCVYLYARYKLFGAPELLFGVEADTTYFTSVYAPYRILLGFVNLLAGAIVVLPTDISYTHPDQATAPSGDLMSTATRRAEDRKSVV